MPEITNAPVAQTQVEPSKVIIIGKFAGMLGRFQADAFSTMVHCGIDKQVAHKCAVDYGSDIGRLMASSAELASKVGKAAKDGFSRLTIRGGGKIITTKSMSLVRVCQQIDALYMEGLLEDRNVPALEEQLVKYTDECAYWASKQVLAK